MAEEPLAASLATLSRFFVGDVTMQEVLTRVAGLTVEAVAPAQLAGITMMVEGRPRTAAFTDEMAPEIDQAQYDTGDGPCLQSFREARVIRLDSTGEPGPWQAFRESAAAHGIGSTLSLPLVVRGAPVGALNLYAPEERVFLDEHIQVGETFAEHAAFVLANAQAYWEARDLSEGLAAAMANRAVIEQAKGMLIAAEGYSDDEAFQVLVAASQRENVKLREVARRMVDDARRRRSGGEAR